MLINAGTFSFFREVQQVLKLQQFWASSLICIIFKMYSSLPALGVDGAP